MGKFIEILRDVFFVDDSSSAIKRYLSADYRSLLTHLRISLVVTVALVVLAVIKKIVF